MKSLFSSSKTEQRQIKRRANAASALRLLIGAQVRLDGPHLFQVRFHGDDQDSADALILLVVACIYSLLIGNVRGGSVDSSYLSILFAHVQRTRLRWQTASSSSQREAIHNVGLTRRIHETLWVGSAQADCAENSARDLTAWCDTDAKVAAMPAECSALLVEQGVVRYVIQPEVCRQAPAQEGKMALLLYEAVAYRLEPDQLVILVEAVSFLRDATTSGAIQTGNPNQIVMQAMATAQDYLHLDLDLAAAATDLRPHRL